MSGGCCGRSSSLRLVPSGRIKLNRERCASILELKRSRILISGPATFELAEGVASSRMACAELDCSNNIQNTNTAEPNTNARRNAFSDLILESRLAAQVNMSSRVINDKV